jgi:hypothetical protein
MLVSYRSPILTFEAYLSHTILQLPFYPWREFLIVVIVSYLVMTLPGIVRAGVSYD